MGVNALRRIKDPAGKVISGLWANAIVRMERFDGCWTFQVPMREIGRTGYFEFSPLERGGLWRTAGRRRTRAGCRYTAEKLFAGECVLRPAYGAGGDCIPLQILDWLSVSLEIANHPSVKGDPEQ